MPEIRSMTSRFAKTCLYGDSLWGVQEFCTHFECTEEEVKAQFHRLWENANDFRERWTTLVRNTERSKMRNKSRRQQNRRKRRAIRAKGVTAEETTVIAEGAQELASASAELSNQEEERLTLDAATRARMAEIEQAFSADKAAMEQLKRKMLSDKAAMGQLKQKMLGDLAEYKELSHRLEDLTKQEDEARRRVRVHVRRGGFVDVHLNGGAWDMDKISAKARDDVPRYLLGFDFSEVTRSEMANVCMAIARCLYAEERLKLEGKEASFDFVDSLTERAYEYACTTRSSEEV